MSDSGISWAICKSAPRPRQTTTPAPHHSVFYRPDALPAAQPTASHASITATTHIPTTNVVVSHRELRHDVRAACKVATAEFLVTAESVVVQLQLEVNLCNKEIFHPVIGQQEFI